MRHEAAPAEWSHKSGALLLVATYRPSTLHTMAQRLRAMRDVTEQAYGMQPSPEARGRHRRATRALAEAELALRVAEGSD